MISIYNSVESPIKDIEILGNTVDGVSVGILQDDGQYKITLFTNNGLDNMSPDYREDKEELLLPCQLEKIGDSTDRLYYDKEEKAWCIYKVGQSKIVLPITFTISLNSFYGTTNLYMVSGEVEGTIKAKVSKSLGASVSSLNDKTDILIDRVSNVVEYVGNEIEKSIENKSDIGHIHQIQDVEGLEDAIEENKTSILNIENELSKSENTSYATENGVKEFECKDGYVDNIVIEGETLVNLCYYPNLRNENSDRYFQRFDNRISGSDTYTIIIPKGKDIGFEVYNANEVGTDYGFGVSGDVGVKVVQIPTDHRIATIHCLKADYSEEELKTICETSIILKGDHTDKHISYFEGLKSVGQGDSIDVLSRCEEGNIFDGEMELGSLGTNGVPVDNANCVRSRNFTPIKDTIPFTSWNDKGYGTYFYYYDSAKNFIKASGEIPSNARYFKFRSIIGNVENDPSVKYVISYNPVSQYAQPQLDKKQISTTLRSLPNGVKDTIEKRGNKYYKIKRCEETTYNGYEDWTLISSTATNTISCALTVTDPKGDGSGSSTISNVYCDKFKPSYPANRGNDEEMVTLVNFTASKQIFIRVVKTKLSTQDVEGFKTWLKSNPVTVVYELETPIIEELPNFNPQTFEGKTTLLINSGVVQAEASFEVTNSIGSEIEVLKGKVSDNDSKLLLKSDKGHYHSCDENMVILWRGSLNAISGDITLTDSIFNYKALIINVGNVGGGKNTSLTIYPFNIGIPTSDGKFRTNEEMYATLFSGSTPYRYYFKPSSTNIGNLYFELRTYNNTIVTTNPDSTLFNIRYIMGVK